MLRGDRGSSDNSYSEVDMSLSEEQRKSFELQSAGKYILEFFPAEYITLSQELATGLHPKLEIILAPLGPDAIDMRLAYIAAYCEVILDGDYSLNDRIKLCGNLYRLLVTKRERPGGIILSS